MLQNLFVYGTLGPGRPNAHILAGIGGTWQEAHVRGRLGPTGWGAALGYPGIILDAHGEIVKGFLFSSEHLEAHGTELDAFEGEEYKRIKVTVTLPDYTSLEAFIYTLCE